MNRSRKKGRGSFFFAFAQSRSKKSPKTTERTHSAIHISTNQPEIKRMEINIKNYSIHLHINGMVAVLGILSATTVRVIASANKEVRPMVI